VLNTPDVCGFFFSPPLLTFFLLHLVHHFFAAQSLSNAAARSSPARGSDALRYLFSFVSPLVALCKRSPLLLRPIFGLRCTFNVFVKETIEPYSFGSAYFFLILGPRYFSPKDENTYTLLGLFILALSLFSCNDFFSLWNPQS